LVSSFFSGNRGAKFLKMFRKRTIEVRALIAAVQQFAAISRTFAVQVCSILGCTLSFAEISNYISIESAMIDRR